MMIAIPMTGRAHGWKVYQKKLQKINTKRYYGDKAPLSWMKKILPSRMIILMLLENKLITNKSQNPTSTGERAGDNADNLWSPILFSYWNLIQLKVTQLNWEQIYGSPKQQINRLVLLWRANRYQWSRYKAPCRLLNQKETWTTTRWELEHGSVQVGLNHWDYNLTKLWISRWSVICYLLSCLILV